MAETIRIADLDKFTRAYIECALWSSTDTDEEGNIEPMDGLYTEDDLASETLKDIAEECKQFQADNGHLFVGQEERAGHDFWLTRNGHGAGFWDGDWPDEVGRQLTDASKAWGSCDLYVGDDGYIHAC
jgi:hypothetical protein